MSAMRRRQLQLFLAVLVAGIFAGLLYSVGIGEVRPLGIAISMAYGVLISAPIAAFETLVTNGEGRRWLRSLPLAVSLGLRVGIYSAVILTVQFGSLGHHLIGVPVDPGERDFSAVLTYSVGIAVLMNVGLEIAILIGPRTLWRFLTGRYHHPREERRFVLFVDVAGSTAAAERLGNLGIHSMLDQVFRIASQPVLEHGGEIHSYVGDTMIVTWPETAGQHPLSCFLGIRAALAGQARRLNAAFGLAPEVRGSLHFGSLVVGEIGDLKRSIVLQGDVMNATARLEAASRDVPGGFIVSDAARLRMGTPTGLAPLGELELRGRQERVTAWRLGNPA